MKPDEKLADLKLWLQHKYDQCACKECRWNDDYGVGSWASHCGNGTANLYDAYPFAPVGQCSGFDDGKDYPPCGEQEGTDASSDT